MIAMTSSWSTRASTRGGCGWGGEYLRAVVLSSSLLTLMLEYSVFGGRHSDKLALKALQIVTAILRSAQTLQTRLLGRSKEGAAIARAGPAMGCERRLRFRHLLTRRILRMYSWILFKTKRIPAQLWMHADDAH